MTYDNHTQNQSFRGSLQARAREKEREKAEKHYKRFCKNCKLLHNPNLEWSTCVQILKSDIEKCCNIGLSAQLARKCNRKDAVRRRPRLPSRNTHHCAFEMIVWYLVLHVFRGADEQISIAGSSFGHASLR